MATSPPIGPTGGARLSGHVYDQLKLRLLDGLYPGGTKLSVDQLRSEFNVSKQPVMDALRSLAADGLVEIFPQVGCSVRSYSKDDVEDFFLLVAGMEETISGIAARKATPERVRQLQAAFNKISHLSDHYTPEEIGRHYRLANREFHSVIHDMAESALITGVSLRVWDLADFMVHVVGAGATFDRSIDERQHDHKELLTAIAAGDEGKAKAVARAHMIHTGKMIFELSNNR
ncbi:GntR family transcriptional regulator [soil metagenome]